MNDLPISLRSATSDDYGYILATWSRDYHKVVPFNFIPNEIYIPHQTDIINTLLNSSYTTIACIDDDPTIIVGYLIWNVYNDSNIIVHWGNVKSIYRRQGVMKEILSSLDLQNKNIICSHYFNLFNKLKSKYSLIYDPTLLETILEK